MTWQTPVVHDCGEEPAAEADGRNFYFEGQHGAEEAADTPAKVRLTDGLGPLPEYAHEFRPRWLGDDGGFTGAQMRLYALQERAAERARWVDAVMAELDGNGQAHAIVAYATRA